MQRPEFGASTGRVPLFSIIVPVYNVDRYLPACVKSVVEQEGEKDWECILVDDGSTDTCGSMCDGFAMVVPGVLALHQENAGLAAARNTGVAAAKGTWVIYLDSDDKMAPGALQALRDSLAETQSGFDWYICRYREFEDGGPERNAPYTPDGLQYTPGAFAAEDYAARVAKLYDSGHWAVWKYCLRRSFLQANKIEFWPDVVWAEDWPYDLLLCKHCKRFYFTDATLTYYRANRDGSLLNTGNLPRRLRGIVAAQQRFARLFVLEGEDWPAAEQREVLSRAADVFWPVARTAAVRDKAVRRACVADANHCRPLYKYGKEGRGQLSWVLFRWMMQLFGARFALWAGSLLHH